MEAIKLSRGKMFRDCLFFELVWYTSCLSKGKSTQLACRRWGPSGIFNIFVLFTIDEQTEKEKHDLLIVVPLHYKRLRAEHVVERTQDKDFLKQGKHLNGCLPPTTGRDFRRSSQCVNTCNMRHNVRKS